MSASLHICCPTADAPQSPGLNANKRLTLWQQQWWLNSLGKWLRLMHGNLSWRSTWRCPAAVHSPRSALMHYLTTDQTHVTACMQAPPSLSFWIYLFIFLLCFLCTRLPCYAGEGKWMSHKGDMSGKEPSSSFQLTRRWEWCRDTTEGLRLNPMLFST